MRRFPILALAVLVLAPVSAGAQGPGMRRQAVQQQQLREQVMQRFMQNLRTMAGLTDEDMGQVREVIQRSMEARAQVTQREMMLWTALEGQMRPGVAARPDSVETLLGALGAIQVERAELAQQDQAALAEFLTPVQRAQVTIALRRLQFQIERIRENRGPPGGMP
ncbi:MAG TPA: hypothetical protein VGA22_09390 [Gemmatimonadales bacterium]